MRRGASGTGLAPANCSTLSAPVIPSRRSSAVELYSNVSGGSGNSTAAVQGASLGNSLALHSNIAGSRSAATSPVGGASGLSSNLSINKEESGQQGSPNRHSNQRTSNEAWVCPNDRQLALRAKLQSGWSVKTAIMNQWKQPEPISAEEHEKIRQVVEKAEAMEKAEEERLGRLVERLENLRQSRLGNGETDCILCGEVFRFYHHSQKRCGECAKMTCGKCGREYALTQGGSIQPHRPSSASLTTSSSMSSSLTSLIGSTIFGGSQSSGQNSEEVATIWLCKICAEQREMWKKSGAWFFKGMPKYAKPLKGSSRARRFSHFTPVAASTSIENLANKGTSSGKDDNSSEDELLLGHSRIPRGSLSSATTGHTSLHHSIQVSRLLHRGESEATDDDDSIPSANGQSIYEVDTDNGRLSRPRALPANIAPPSVRSTSVPPPELSRGDSRGTLTNRTDSPVSSLGSPVTCPLPPPRSHPPPPPVPPRSLSPRYFRPGPPPHLRGAGPPPWGPRGFRPPFDPRFSPRGMPRRPPHMRGPPPRHRLPGPPRGPPGVMRPPRGPPFGPPRFASFPHSAPHSPMTCHRMITEAQPRSLGAFSADSPCSPTPSLPPMDFHPHPGAGATGLERDTPPYGKPDEELEDDEEEEEVPSPPRSFTKAKPLPERENKFTSTLRRLSTVRKRNKTKRKCKEKELASNGDSGIEAVTTPSSSHDLRPSSTTSRESEAEALTSGYFRQESQSRGSDETISPPKSPEGSHGLIEFSVAYDEATQDLLVNVIKAKKLKGMDANGLCDSYCQVTLTSSLNMINAQCCRKTKTVSKNINPHYNANLHFPAVSYDVFMATSIHLAILDEDLAGDYLLAEAKFPLKKVLPQLQKKFQISLEKPDLRNTFDGLILSGGPTAGRLELSLGFYAKSGTLKVLIIQCQDLPPVNSDGTANPFVKAVLHPLNKNSKHETTVKWKSTSPEFHEQFVYLTSSTELPKQSLHITVWDRGKNGPDKYIGGITLGMNAKGQRLQHWLDMIKSPGCAQAKIHHLSANYID